MFGTHFYHQRIRKAVAVFGSLFNDIHVVRKDAAGNSLSQVKVPLSYSPKRDFLARIDAMNDGENAERQIALKLPRLSFEILAMQYDASRQMPRTNACVVFPDNYDDGASKLYTPVPYIVSFQLNAYAKTQDDALQIVEQILPYFTPNYTVTIKPLNDFEVVEDSPITMTGITFSDDYEAPLENRRSIIYTMDFDMKLYLYKSVADGAKIIEEACVNFLNLDGGADEELFVKTCTDSAWIASPLSIAAIEDTAFTVTDFEIRNLISIPTSLSVSDPLHGTASVSLTETLTTENGIIKAIGTYSYTPDIDYSGLDSFNISVLGDFGTKSYPVAVNVAAVTDTVNDTAECLGNTSVDIQVGTNDTWSDTTLVFSLAVGGDPSNGTVEVINASTGVLRYTPTIGYVGADSFVYRVTPTVGTSEVGTVNINVAENPNIDGNFANVVYLVNAVDGESSPATYASDASTFNNSLVTVNGVHVKQGLTTLFQAKSMEGTGSNGRIESTFTGTGGILGAGDFTMEGWFYTLQSGNREMATTHSNVGVNDGLGLKQIAVTHEVRVTRGFSNFDTSGTPLNLNAWNHVAVTREGTDLRIFVNGVLGRTETNDTQDYSSNFLQIQDATRNGSGLAWEGFIEDFRITKGVARYTTNFSVPTQAFPTS